MKITYRIPSKDAYGYVEFEIDAALDSEGMRQAVDDMEDLMEYHKVGAVGLTAKELDLIIEKMCLGTTVEGGTELWSKATQAQKDQINCLKRALNRIKTKHSKRTEDDESYGEITTHEGQM